jgi:hypothetical protein
LNEIARCALLQCGYKAIPYYCSSTSAKYPLGFRPLALPYSSDLRELGRVVVAEQIDFVLVVASQPPDVLQARLP